MNKLNILSISAILFSSFVLYMALFESPYIDFKSSTEHSEIIRVNDLLQRAIDIDKAQYGEHGFTYIYSE